MVAIEIETEIEKTRGAPAWLITFSDLMALLFAFFVLMLSLSEVDDGSFRRNAGPISEAFNQPPPVAAGNPALKGTPTTPGASLQLNRIFENSREIRQRSDLIAKLRFAFGDQIRKGLVSIYEFTDNVVLRSPAARAFAADSADLNVDTEETIGRVARVLAAVGGRTRISGHTDDVPIASNRFRSNWELSTARAVSVVHRAVARRRYPRVTDLGRRPRRNKPIALNDTPERRQASRRVDIGVDLRFGG